MSGWAHQSRPLAVIGALTADAAAVLVALPGAFLAVPVATIAAALLGYAREARAEQRRAAVAANGRG